MVEVEVPNGSTDIDLFSTRLTDVDLSGVSLDDPVRIYLREIGRVPLLTGEQEVTLAQAMERGDYLFRIQQELREPGTGVPPASYCCGGYFSAVPPRDPIARTLYDAAFPDRPATTKTRVLADVLPITMLPDQAIEHAIAQMCDQPRGSRRDASAATH